MRRVDDEAGTGVVLVAVLMTLLLAIVTFVVDTGRLFDEHGQLQNGADAAALAIASDCARVPAACASHAASIAELLGNQNARDGVSSVPAVDIWTSDGDRGRVTVQTRSLGADGAEAVPRSLPQGDGSDAVTVWAEAAALWGPARTATTLSMTVSVCDWRRIVDAQGGYHEGPAGGDLGFVIDFHNPSPPPPQDDPGDTGAPGVPADPEDPTAPGEDEPSVVPEECIVDGRPVPSGFAELAGGGGCELQTVLTEPSWARGGNGRDLSQIGRCLVAGRVLPVPVFVDACDQHTQPCPGGVQPSGYQLAGYGTFLLTGWRLPSSSSTPAPQCAAAEPMPRCISGYFVRDVLPGAMPADPDGSHPGYGASGVRLTAPTLP